MINKEPCLCGAPDCARCFPTTYMYEAYEDDDDRWNDAADAAYEMARQAELDDEWIGRMDDE